MKKDTEAGTFIHVSLRVPAGLRNQLNDEAKHRNITLNSLINAVLSKYLAFDKIVESTKAIPLSGAFFRELLEITSTEQMENIGEKLGPMVVRQSFAFLDIDFNLDNLIKYYFEPLSVHSGWYMFNNSFEGASRKLMFRHSHGPNWSAFLKRYIANIILSATGSEPEIAIEDGMLTFTFK